VNRQNEGGNFAHQTISGNFDFKTSGVQAIKKHPTSNLLACQAIKFGIQNTFVSTRQAIMQKVFVLALVLAASVLVAAGTTHQSFKVQDNFQRQEH
jgi:predicted nuclease with RNAse H fold